LPHPPLLPRADEVVVIIRGLDNTTEVSRPIPWLTAGTANAEAIIEQMQIAGDVTVTTWGLTTGTTVRARVPCGGVRVAP
jgi:hypothetical protein